MYLWTWGKEGLKIQKSKSKLGIKLLKVKTTHQRHHQQSEKTSQRLEKWIFLNFRIKMEYQASVKIKQMPHLSTYINLKNITLGEKDKLQINMHTYTTWTHANQYSILLLTECEYIYSWIKTCNSKIPAIFEEREEYTDDSNYICSVLFLERNYFIIFFLIQGKIRKKEEGRRLAGMKDRNIG